MAKLSKSQQLTEEEFKKIILESKSFAQCCRKIGYCDKGRHGADAIRKRCTKLNLDTSHFNQSNSNNVQKYSLDEILVKNSTYYQVKNQINCRK